MDRLVVLRGVVKTAWSVHSSIHPPSLSQQQNNRTARYLTALQSRPLAVFLCFTRRAQLAAPPTKRNLRSCLQNLSLSLQRTEKKKVCAVGYQVVLLSVSQVLVIVLLYITTVYIYVCARVHRSSADFCLLIMRVSILPANKSRRWNVHVLDDGR